MASIGQDASGGTLAASRVFNGVIDDVAVFTRTLSSADIQNLYAGVPLAPPLAPTGLTATAGDGQVALSWNATVETDSYIVKRSTVNGGPYSIIASNLTSSAFTDTGLVNGTWYYYVVSSANLAGQSPNSTQASAQPIASTRPNISYGTSGNQFQLTWPADHTGWLLEAQTNTVSVGLSTNWVTIPGSSSVNSWTIPIDAAQGSVFFRLVHP